MNVLSSGVVSVMLLAGACTGPVLEEEVESPLASIEDTPEGIAATCGVSPSSITYWATEAARDVFDENGLIGSCVYDAACLPSCWGTTSQWSSWSRPLIECPCPAQR